MIYLLIQGDRDKEAIVFSWPSKALAMTNIDEIRLTTIQKFCFWAFLFELREEQASGSV